MRKCSSYVDLRCFLLPRVRLIDHVPHAQSVQSTRSMTPTYSPANPDMINLDVPFLDPEVQPATGLIMEQG